MLIINGFAVLLGLCGLLHRPEPFFCCLLLLAACLCVVSCLMCIYMYIYIYTHITVIYIYIYMYVGRERERRSRGFCCFCSVASSCCVAQSIRGKDLYTTTNKYFTVSSQNNELYSKQLVYMYKSQLWSLAPITLEPLLCLSFLLSFLVVCLSLLLLSLAPNWVQEYFATMLFSYGQHVHPTRTKLIQLERNHGQHMSRPLIRRPARSSARAGRFEACASSRAVTMIV